MVRRITRRRHYERASSDAGYDASDKLLALASAVEVLLDQKIEAVNEVLSDRAITASLERDPEGRRALGNVYDSIDRVRSDLDSLETRSRLLSDAIINLGV